jgi:hypothetical protein
VRIFEKFEYEVFDILGNKMWFDKKILVPTKYLNFHQKINKLRVRSSEKRSQLRAAISAFNCAP